jgi:hypothetical protein
MNKVEALYRAKVAAAVFFLALAFLPQLCGAAAPAIEAITLYSDAAMTAVAASFNPTAGGNTAVYVRITVNDSAGAADINYTTIQVLKLDNTTHVEAANATLEASSGNQSNYTWSFNMTFYDDAALDTSNYGVNASATSQAGETGSSTQTQGTFNYQELAALDVSLATISFGSLAQGTISSAVTQTVTNKGNVIIDLKLYGTNLNLTSPSATIAVTNAKYATAGWYNGAANVSVTDAQASAMVGETASQLQASEATVAAFDLAKGADSTKNVYWDLHIPSGLSQFIPSGIYSGTITFTAVKST